MVALLAVGVASVMGSLVAPVSVSLPKVMTSVVGVVGSPPLGVVVAMVTVVVGGVVGGAVGGTQPSS